MSARKKKEDEPVIEGAEGQYVIDEPDEVKHDGLVILRKVQRTKGHRKMYAITEDGWKMVEKLYGINCTPKEVASVLGIDRSVLFNDLNREQNLLAQDRGKEGFHEAIRASQYNIMKRGDSRMAIWLGKQYLGQQDTVSQDITVRQTSDPATMSLDDMMKAISRAEKKFSETGDGDDDKDLRGRVHRRPPSLVQGSP